MTQSTNDNTESAGLNYGILRERRLQGIYSDDFLLDFVRLADQFTYSREGLIITFKLYY